MLLMISVSTVVVPLRRPSRSESPVAATPKGVVTTRTRPVASRTERVRGARPKILVRRPDAWRSLSECMVRTSLSWTYDIPAGVARGARRAVWTTRQRQRGAARRPCGASAPLVGSDPLPRRKLRYDVPTTGALAGSREGDSEPRATMSSVRIENRGATSEPDDRADEEREAACVGRGDRRPRRSPSRCIGVTGRPRSTTPSPSSSSTRGRFTACPTPSARTPTSCARTPVTSRASRTARSSARRTRATRARRTTGPTPPRCARSSTACSTAAWRGARCTSCRSPWARSARRSPTSASS